MLDKATLQQNKKRWQAVAKFEQEEERKSTPLDRWKKLNALFRMANHLNLAIDMSSQEEELVWNRWNKLREIHLSGRNS